MVEVSVARFEELVSEALDDVPDELAVHMDNVAVFVEDEPGPQQQPHEGDELLGLYEGIDLTQRGDWGAYDMVMPDRITVFRIPLMRICRSEAELRREVTRTVIHEIGHHFGIDDDRLHELGWG